MGERGKCLVKAPLFHASWTLFAHSCSLDYGALNQGLPLTHHCQRVHFDELETFILPLMLRKIQPTITNTFSDQPCMLVMSVVGEKVNLTPKSLGVVA